jgi:hypothetical protein
MRVGLAGTVESLEYRSGRRVDGRVEAELGQTLSIINQRLMILRWDYKERFQTK